ncbi:MAG: hypothetical protein Q8M76_12310 [Spirochaetaceae bacterium]|nr:hypothetical protein [Spirochaetaceae bacterium]
MKLTESPLIVPLAVPVLLAPLPMDERSIEPVPASEEPLWATVMLMDPVT